MAINEDQLDIWSKQGSVPQSKATYATIKSALEDSNAPYSDKDYNIFLQGSYGNDTNVYADSDVDVIIVTDSMYYQDLTNLTLDEQALYNSVTTTSSYSYAQFKMDVIAQLKNKFGGSVKLGKKAIFVESNGTRRDADVVAATEYRRYLNFRGLYNQNYIEGICFWTSNGTQIINYPKQHSENCTRKHQETGGWFKPTVRILKNMRNTMIAKGYLSEGIAPSYFLEGMLYNVPNEKFGRSYNETIIDAINWIINCDRSKLECANEQYYLLHPTSHVTWRAEHLQTYLNAVVTFWK